ncbi:MAG: DNA primase [Deltaproteobacteria bacterium]
MTESAVQEVKEAADIIAIIGERVNLIKSGINYKGLCPFHSEKTPSFTVNPARQSYYCFGCGEGGDVFSFLMKYDNISFPEALQEVARRYNIILPEKKGRAADQALAQKRLALQAINSSAASCYHDFLLGDPAAREARNYLAHRGMTKEIIEEFVLGFAPDNWDFISRQLRKYPAAQLKEAGLVIEKKGGGHYDRFRRRILFPIFDINGKVVGFGGRIVGEGQPKYLNTDRTLLFDKGRTLFGLYQNKDAIRRQKQCLVVEGNFDLLALAASGIRNVIAPLGTALTAQHVRKLKGYADEVILLFDGDNAGLKAAMRAVPLFLDELIEARVAILPKDHDPDTFVRQFGKDGLLSHLETARPLAEFCFAELVKKHGTSLGGKARIVKDLGQLIASLDDLHLQRTIFINHFSEKLHIEPAKLAHAAASRQGPPKEKKAKPVGKTELPIKHRQLLEFLLSYPQYLPTFRQAGIEEVLSEAAGKILLDLLITQYEQHPEAGPETLLLTTGPEIKALASKLLTTAPRYDEEQREQIAATMVAWLKQRGMQRRTKTLTEKIEAAQKNKDEELLTRLLEEKKSHSRRHTTENSFNG